jgi:RND family efflux transporter MFP subunit
MPARPSLDRPERPRLAVALAAAALAACGGKATPAEAPPPAFSLGPENVAVVETATLQTGPLVSGTLRARREATARAEVAGTVQAVLAEPGEPVRKGGVVLRIDDGPIRDQVAAARSALRAAEDALQLTRRELGRTEGLASAGSVAARDLDRARSQVASQEAMAADARARLVVAEQQLDRTAPRAPFDGMLAERPVNAGDVVAPGTPLFTVVFPGDMRLEAAVPAEYLSRARVGTPVDFRVVGQPERVLRGHIEQVNPVVDPATGQIRIYVTIPNEGGPLLAGLFARGRVVTEQVTGLALPLAAVDASATPPAVLRVRDGVVEKVSVELGVSDPVAEKVQVKEGLAAGDVVLLASARTNVGPGARVTVAAAAPSRPAP